MFIAYAPADDPTIALAVIVENGGHGGSSAGPIARKVMDYYLLGRLPASDATKESKNMPPSGNTSRNITTPQAAVEEELHD